jgi:hypothetical protein
LCANLLKFDLPATLGQLMAEHAAMTKMCGAVKANPPVSVIESVLEIQANRPAELEGTIDGIHWR